MQTPGVDLDKRGRAVQGITVHFTTGKGNSSSVFVPKADYSADTVRGLILEHARELDAVSDLKG